MNKKMRNNRILTLLFLAMLVFTIGVPFVSASTTTTYTENYESPDANLANPSESWYSYSESGIWANVTNNTGSDLPNSSSNQSFRMNTTVDTTGGSLYDFVDRSYDSFQLDVKINSSSHNFTMITIGTWIDNDFYTGHGAFCYWLITNDTITFNVVTVADGNVTTEVLNESINNNTWYRLKVEFDYDTYEVTGTIWNEWGIAGVPILLDTDSATSIIPFTNITQSFWAIPENLHGNDSCYIFMDDFILTDTVLSSSEETTNYLTDTVIPLLAVVAGLLVVIGLLFAVGVTYESFITAMVVVIVLITFLTAII